MLDLSQFVGPGVGVAVILGIVEMIKRAKQDDQGVDHLPKQIIPLLDVGIGVVFHLALAMQLHTDLGMAVFVGLLTGMMASGVYSGGKAALGN